MMETIENLQVKIEVTVMKKEGYSTDRKFVEIKREKTCAMTLERAKTELEEIARPTIGEALDEINELVFLAEPKTE